MALPKFAKPALHKESLVLFTLIFLSSAALLLTLAAAFYYVQAFLFYTAPGIPAWQGVAAWLFASGCILAGASWLMTRASLRRRSAEEALRASEARLRRLTESMLDVITETDEFDKLVYVSPSARTVFGHAPESMLGRSIFEIGLIHPDDRECVQAEINAVYRSGKDGGGHHWKQEYRLRHAAGHYIWVESYTRFIFDEKHNFVTAVTTTREITTRKQAEETLRRGEEKYRRLFENTLAGIYRSTLEEGKLLEANAAIREMTGYAEIEGVSSPQLYADPSERQKMIAQLREQGEIRNFETLFRRKDGSLFWGSLSATLYRDEGYLEGVLIDISERKRAEAELERSLSVLQATLESTQDGILAVDIRGQPINYNRQFLEMWQQTEEIMTAPDHMDRIAHLADKTIDPESFLRRLQEIYQQPDLESYDVIHLKDGRIFERYGKAQHLGSRIVGRVWNLRDITRRRQAEEALQRALKETQEATSRLTTTVSELERRAQEAFLLNKMGDLLQTCNSADEVYTVVSRSAPELFPQEAGALAIQNDGRTLVEVVAKWGAPQMRDEVFQADVCWALRRGQVHFEENSATPLCKHMINATPLSYLCVPLTAHGESLGVLHVQSNLAANGDNGNHNKNHHLFTEARKQLAINIAERVALSLANINLRDSLQRQAIHDPLTGLYNRRYMNEALEREIRRSRRRRQPLSLIMLDIDHFKNYNDTYGHQAGDILLREMAVFLQSNVRAEDIVCRYGGEEFTVILPSATLEDALRRSEQIWEGVKCLEVEYRGRMLPSITLSLGVAELTPEHGNTVEALLRDADDALYQAKETGRNRVVVLDGNARNKIHFPNIFSLEENMQFTKLGRTGLKVSQLCLGTMNFGPQTNEADSFAIMDRALELGINFFDTANVYGWKLGEGVTEQIIGRWFAQGGGRREKVVIATKVFGRMSEWPNDSRLSAYHIRRACEESLRRMQTDHIDLYQMHHVDRDTPWEEIWQAMETLVQQGKVLYVGSSNFAGWHIAKAQGEAKARHFMGLVCEQSLYNLKDRMVELEVIPACRDFGLGLIPWSPLAGGLLGGALQKANEGRRAAERVQEAIEKNRGKLEAYEAFCQEMGEQPADVALAWLLHNPVVTAPIIGPRTLEQLNGSLRALEIKLDEEQIKKLDEIWPGPGGEAPEAYAW